MGHTRPKVAVTAGAFLIQGGGQVLFGVSPTGAIVGRQISKRAIRELSAEARRVDPPAFPVVESVPHEVIVVRTDQGHRSN